MYKCTCELKGCYYEVDYNTVDREGNPCVDNVVVCSSCFELFYEKIAIKYERIEI